MPAVFTVLAIPAFYLLASVLLKDKVQVVFAAFIFTFIPASFDWLVMGGGLTRSPAFFFALLSLYFMYRMYTQNRKQDVIWVSFFRLDGAQPPGDRPAHGCHHAGVLPVLWPGQKGVLKSLLVAGLVLAVTAPWWETVGTDGIAPFLAAGRTGVYSVEGILQIFQSNFTHEIGLQIIAALALVGFFWQISQRKYFIPVWALVILISEPRSAPLFLCPCSAILAGTALIGIMSFFNRAEIPPRAGIGEPHPLSGTVSRVLFILLSVFWIVSSMGTVYALLNSAALTNLDQKSFDWVISGSGSQDEFLVLTGNSPQRSRL